MGFDLVTFLAQIVNLFVLVWLLKRFLYRPILNVIDKRQSEIDATIERANQAEKDAVATQQNLMRQEQAFEDARQQRINDLTQEINALKAQEKESLQHQVSLERAKIQVSLKRELNTIEDDLRSVLTTQFLDMARQMMTALSDLSPMDQTLNLFKKQLDSLSEKEKSNINKTLKKQYVIIITSSETLSKEQESDLVRLLRKTFDVNRKTTVQFRVDDTLLLGLNITMGDLALEWNVRTYLDTLEDNLTDALTRLKIKE